MEKWKSGKIGRSVANEKKMYILWYILEIEICQGFRIDKNRDPEFTRESIWKVHFAEPVLACRS
jgi:hypothetical protein